MAPFYCYKREDNGKVVTVAMTMKKMAMRQNGDRIRLTAQEDREDGPGMAVRDYPSEHGRSGRRMHKTFPMLSDAAGVAPHQAKEAEEHSRRIGIPTEFTRDGRARFTDARHRKRYCEAVGLYDRNGGYSDPQRRSDR